MIKNKFEKIPKKITFFGIVLSKSFGPAEKTHFFFRKFDPLRDGSDAMIRISIRGKETCIRKDSKKKIIFWGFFEM